jgi:hypothetical protein
MSVYEFGSGVLTGTRTDIANATPRRFGVLQDVSIDFAGEVKTLFGMNQYPEDTARGKTKIEGKAKFAGIQASGYNDLFFGQTLATGSTQYAYNERTTLASSTTSISYTTANATSSPLVDQGVFYGGTGTNSGVQLTYTTTSPPTSANYNFNTSTGIYTFAAADSSAAVLVNYTYQISTGYNIAINQQLMGTTPRFGLTLFQVFEGHQMVLNLFSATSSKLTYPTRIDDYVIAEMDFAAFSNAAEQVGVWNFAQ